MPPGSDAVTPTILLTRPQEASARFAAQIGGVTGWPVLIAPLLRIVPVAHDAARLRDAVGLVFTSENGVAAAGEGRGRPAICVGPRTAQAARAAGFEATAGPGDAARLMPMLAGLGLGWLHPRGAHIAAELPVPGITVYDQQALPLSAAGRALLRGQAPVVLPLFSPRSARLAAQAARDAAAPLWLAAISAAAAAAWGQAGGPVPARRVVADAPDAGGMARAIAALGPPDAPRMDAVERGTPGAG